MIGVILTNFGGPRTLSEVRPFLNDIFGDVLPRPLRPLRGILARLREPYAKKMYAAIGGASPVVSWTKWQAMALEQKLNEGDRFDNARNDYKVYAGMKYGSPSIADAISEARADGCRQIIELAAYPFRSRYTSMSSAKPWHTHPLFIRAMEDIVNATLLRLKAEKTSDVTILFSVHAVPLSAIAHGDPYLEEVRGCFEELARRFGTNRCLLAFQSATGPVRWTGPSVKETLTHLRAQALKHLLIVPLGFACENIETLYEIDQIYIPMARLSGIPDVARAQALNDHPQFIDLLSKLVLDSLK